MIFCHLSGKPPSQRRSTGSLLSAPGFECKIGEYVVKVWEWTNVENDTPGMTATLSNRSNPYSPIDRMTAEQFESDYAKLSDLHTIARRSALNVDEVISELEAALRKL